MKQPWSMNARAGGDELEILLYSEIGDSGWGDGVTAKQFAEDLRAAGARIRKIHLRISSPGGAVFDGLAIYNTLRGHGARITAQVDGLAASIASVILMAADAGGISMAASSLLMIHNPWAALTGGDANDMRKMATTLDKTKSSMVGAYRRHSSLSAEKISALMDAETWMTAEESVDNGFADDVMEDPDEDDLAAAVLQGPIFAKFKNVPPQIAARLHPRGESQPPACERDRQRLQVELLRRLP
jgi:ATP-dependent Clp protease protease subunit